MFISEKTFFNHAVKAGFVTHSKTLIQFSSFTMAFFIFVISQTIVRIMSVLVVNVNMCSYEKISRI